jgi:hypothetical protein
MVRKTFYLPMEAVDLLSALKSMAHEIDREPTESALVWAALQVLQERGKARLMEALEKAPAFKRGRKPQAKE